MISATDCRVLAAERKISITDLKIAVLKLMVTAAEFETLAQ